MPPSDATPAAEYRVLCAGAVRIGVERCMAAYEARTGARGTAEFVTGLALRDRVASGAAGAEVIVAPDREIEALYRSGRINRAPQHALGRVAAGVIVGNDGPLPDIATVEALAAAVRGADAVLFASGSVSAVLERWMEQTGLMDTVRDRTLRFPHGADVIRAIAAGGRGNAIGFAQSTEIRRLMEEGIRLRYVGSLPGAAAIQTRYMAGLSAGPQPRVARRFVRYLGNVAAKPALIASGIEQDGD